MYNLYQASRKEIVLDITKYGITNLRSKIFEDVEKTQTPILRPLPNILLMTKEQYDVLNMNEDMQKMYQSKDRVFITPLNVMEVRVL